MQSIQQQAAEYWNSGILPANICRLLNITHQELSAWVHQYPDLFRWQGDNNPDHPVSDDIRGRMPPKAPGTEGVPQCMILHGMCRFHHQLCCEAVSDKPLLAGDQA